MAKRGGRAKNQPQISPPTNDSLPPSIPPFTESSSRRQLAVSGTLLLSWILFLAWIAFHG